MCLIFGCRDCGDELCLGDLAPALRAIGYAGVPGDNPVEAREQIGPQISFGKRHDLDVDGAPTVKRISEPTPSVTYSGEGRSTGF